MRYFTFLLALFLLAGCDEQKEQSAPVLPSSVAAELNKSIQDALGQSAQAISDVIAQTDAAVQESIPAMQNMTKEISQSVSQAAQSAAEAASQILNSAQNASNALGANASDIISSVSNKSQDVIKQADIIVKDVAKSVNQSVSQAAQKADNIIKAASASSANLENGKKVFAKCIACHGKNANLSALKNSQDISKWSADEIVKSLKGYKAGTYGGKMKISMAPIVKPLSEADMNDVAHYIKTLN